jgi:peptidyl-tRNA hydrolase
VLSKFSKSEEQKLNDLVEIAAESIECWMDEGINTTMNRYNKMYL